MTSGCKVGVLIPGHPLRLPLALSLGSVLGVLSHTPVRCGWVGYRGSPLHTGVCFDCDLWIILSHKLILESELWHHATTGKSMLLLYRFHFLDVCRHLLYFFAGRVLCYLTGCLQPSQVH